MTAEHPAIIWQRHIVAEHAVLASNMLVAFEFATTDGAGAGRWVVLLLSLAELTQARDIAHFVHSAQGDGLYFSTGARAIETASINRRCRA